MSSESTKIELFVQEVHDESLSESFHRSRFEKRFSGWRLGVLPAFVAVSTVLHLTSIFTIWATISFDVEDRIGTVHEGSCGKSRSVSLWLHFVINTLVQYCWPAVIIVGIPFDH